MKKFNLVAIILVAAIACTGIGYAAWNQSVWINGTVTTGNFDVIWDNAKLVCNSGPQVTAKVEPDPADPKHGLILSVDNIYPGAEFSFNPKALNVGTISAKPANVTIVSVEDNDAIFPFIEYWGGFNWSKDGSIVNGPALIVDNDWKPLSGIGTDLTSDATFMGVNLDPNGWLEFGQENSIHIRMSPAAPNDSTEGKTLKFKLSVDWIQSVP